MTGSDYLLMQVAQQRIDQMLSQAKRETRLRKALREIALKAKTGR